MDPFCDTGLNQRIKIGGSFELLISVLNSKPDWLISFSANSVPTSLKLMIIKHIVLQRFQPTLQDAGCKTGHVYDPGRNPVQIDPKSRPKCCPSDGQWSQDWGSSNSCCKKKNFERNSNATCWRDSFQVFDILNFWNVESTAFFINFWCPKDSIQFFKYYDSFVWRKWHYFIQMLAKLPYMFGSLQTNYQFNLTS